MPNRAYVGFELLNVILVLEAHFLNFIFLKNNNCNMKFEKFLFRIHLYLPFVLGLCLIFSLQEVVLVSVAPFNLF